jgi:hypothetical protein
MRTNKIFFKQMCLNAILAVRSPATWGLDGISEDPIVDRADDAWVLWRTLANFDLGEALGLHGLLLPWYPAETVWVDQKEE